MRVSKDERGCVRGDEEVQGAASRESGTVVEERKARRVWKEGSAPGKGGREGEKEASAIVSAAIPLPRAGSHVRSSSLPSTDW